MTLTEEQLSTLRAALDRIIPADDYPAAWEAGVGVYILRQLECDLAPLAENYRQGLDALEADARAREGDSFSALMPDQQDALLRKVEAGDVATPWDTQPRQFFDMLVNHAAEGYYSDPGNGGNYNELSWKMVGFDQNRDPVDQNGAAGAQ